jgi:lipopolysaccharide export system protein LptC
MPMISIFLGLWDRLSLYLPIGLMGLVALGTYWLVQSTPVNRVTSVAVAARHEPDYFMKHFSVRTFAEAGRLKSEVFGVAARHFPDTDTLEIDSVRIRAFDDQGLLTTATANLALTNGDGSEVQLFGKAQIVREAQVNKVGQTTPRIEFRGEFLHAYLKTDRVVSNRPVELRRGLDVFLAETMDYDKERQTMLMQGRVRGTLVPIAGK